jgi:hypothetical protein
MKKQYYKYREWVYIFFVSITIVLTISCNKESGKKESSFHKEDKINFVKAKSPITLSLSYTLTSEGDYYILAILTSQKYTPTASFEIDVPQPFIKSGVKKWAGEIEANVPKLLEITVSKDYTKREITGIFMVSIFGNIFTVNEVLNLQGEGKPILKNGFIEKTNEKNEKIADFKVKR